MICPWWVFNAGVLVKLSLISRSPFLHTPQVVVSRHGIDRSQTRTLRCSSSACFDNTVVISNTLLLHFSAGVPFTNHEKVQTQPAEIKCLSYL